MSWRLNKWDDKNKVRRMRNVEGKEWLQLKCNSPWRGWGSSLSDFWKELPVERTANANNLRQKYAFCAQSGDQSGWRRERESVIEKGGRGRRGEGTLMGLWRIWMRWRRYWEFEAEEHCDPMSLLYTDSKNREREARVCWQESKWESLSVC